MAHLLDTFRFANHCMTKNKIAGNELRLSGENQSTSANTSQPHSFSIQVSEEEDIQHT
jgi:hypothetical protein